jgi:hypothetical protein
LKESEAERLSRLVDRTGAGRGGETRCGSIGVQVLQWSDDVWRPCDV